MSSSLDDIRPAVQSHGVVLLLTDSRRVADVSMEAVDAFLDSEDGQVIYITTSKPYRRVARTIRETGLDDDRILFIDTASGTSAMRADNVIFMRPEDLTSMAITISTAAETMVEDGKRVMVVIDTLSSLLIHNTESVIIRFTQELTTRIRGWGADAAYLMLRSDSSRMLNRVAMFADRQVTVTD